MTSDEVRVNLLPLRGLTRDPLQSILVALSVDGGSDAPPQ